MTYLLAILCLPAWLYRAGDDAEDNSDLDLIDPNAGLIGGVGSLPTP